MEKTLRRGIILTVANAAIFSIAPPAIRAAYADGVNAVFLLIALAVARVIGLGGFCLWTRRPIFQSRKDLRQAFTGGFFQAIAMAGVSAALVFLTGPLVIMILFTHTLMLLFFVAWKGQIKLTRSTVLTTVTALAGLTLVLDIWHTKSAASLIGMGLAFIAALATVVRLYVFGQQVKAHHPVVSGTETYIFTLLFLVPTIFVQSPVAPLSTSGWEWVLLACLAGTIGTFGMFYGISLLGSFRWSLFAKLEPVFTALFSALLIGEILKFHQYVGMAVIVGSLALYQLMEQRAKIPPQNAMPEKSL